MKLELSPAGRELALGFFTLFLLQKKGVDHMTDFELLSIMIMILALVVSSLNHKADK